MRNTLCVSVCILAILAASCQSNKKHIASVQYADTAVMTFVDLPHFDRELSFRLKECHSQVVVDFVGDVSANNLPDRLENWLVKLEDYGGAVDLKPEPALMKDTKTRSLLLSAATIGVTLIYKFHKYLKQREMYSYINNYDAILFHVPGHARLTRVIFLNTKEESSIEAALLDLKHGGYQSPFQKAKSQPDAPAESDAEQEGGLQLDTSNLQE